MEASRCAYKRNIILNSVRQHSRFTTQGNYNATCFDYRLVILRPILSIVSQGAMHTLGSRRVYVHEIHQIKSFVSKDVTRKLQLARHALRDKRFNLMYSMDVNTTGSQSVHSIL